MKHLGTKTIETERLLLRKTIDTDAEYMFYNWANDARVTKFMTWEPYENAQQLRESYHQYLMENRDKPDFYDWKIELKSLGQPVGAIGVTVMREDIEAVEIGYCLGYDWWHQGIMTEALRTVIQFLFEEVGFNRITAKHDVNNPHSGGVMKNAGMQYEGTNRQAGINQQGICDIATYAILKQDYFR